MTYKTFISSIFNLKPGEWSRVLYAWLLRFLYSSGFVIGWTLMISIFVDNFGISALPYLFILNAFFVIIGSTFFSLILEKFSHRRIMLANLVASIFILSFSSKFNEIGDMVLFSFLLIVSAVFLGQFRIMLLGLIEEMFTPLESERTFPIVEAADTVAGVVSGLIISYFAINIDPYLFTYFWLAFLFILLIVFLFSYKLFKKTSKVKTEEKERYSGNILKKMSVMFSTKNRRSYLIGMFLVIFFNWLLFNLMEFQYTKAVYSSSSEHVLSGGLGLGNVFIKDLGTLFVIFSSAALIVQLFIASRLIKFLGVIGGIMLHPIVNFFSVIGFNFLPGFASAVFLKTNFSISKVIYHDAYHSSYYAIDKDIRPYMHEVGEGIIRPLGAIVGTGVLLLLHLFFDDSELFTAINVAMVLICIVFFIITLVQQKKYYALARQVLSRSSVLEDRLEAVEILTQNVKINSREFLLRYLLDDEESKTLRLRILDCFVHMKDKRLIDDLILCFKSNDFEVKKRSLEILIEHKFNKFFGVKNYLLEGKLINALKELYENDKNQNIRELVIEVMSTLNPVSAFDFILQILDKAPNQLKDDAIFALRKYKDQRVVESVLPYLTNRNLKLKLYSAIVLYDYELFKSRSLAIIKEYLSSRSSSSKKIALGLFAVGELKLLDFENYAEKFLDFKNYLVRLHAAISLIKIGKYSYLDDLVDILFSMSIQQIEDHKLRILKLRKSLPKKEEKRFLKLIDLKIRKILEEDSNLVSMKSSNVIELKKLYLIAEQNSIVENLETFLKCDINVDKRK